MHCKQFKDFGCEPHRDQSMQRFLQQCKFIGARMYQLALQVEILAILPSEFWEWPEGCSTSSELLGSERIFQQKKRAEREKKVPVIDVSHYSPIQGEIAKTPMKKRVLVMGKSCVGHHRRNQQGDSQGRRVRRAFPKQYEQHLSRRAQH